MPILAAAVLAGPGVLLAALLSRRRSVEAPLLAAAAWVIAFWWLRLVPLDWHGPVMALGLASLCAGVALRPRLPDPASVAVWLVAAAVFAVMASSVPVAPGVDGAMHTAVARVLGDAHGHPASFRPLWPVDVFGSYPVGQPTLTALLGELARLDWRRAGLAGHALAYALVVVGFAAALSRWAGGTASGLAAGTLAVLAARSPLHFWSWGGAPNVLGIAFAVAAVAAARDALDDARSGAACAIFAAASLLTHGTSAAAFIYATLPIVAIAAIARPALRRGVARLALAGLGALFLCAPWLATLRPVLGPREIAWVAHASREAATLASFPRALHDVPLIAGVLAAAVLLVRDRRRAAVPLAVAAMLVVLVAANGRRPVLPLSVLLYPDRIAVLLLLPIAALVHDTLVRAPRALVLAACVALCTHALLLQAKTIRDGREHALATDADLRLIAALPRCPIVTNYGDAGQWIPALAALPITFPQVNVVFFDEVASRVHPCAAFRGSRRPYFVDTLPCPGPVCVPERSDGGAELFRITDPGYSVELDAYR